MSHLSPHAIAAWVAILSGTIVALIAVFSGVWAARRNKAKGRAKGS
jgi:hypothetical protein